MSSHIFLDIPKVDLPDNQRLREILFFILKRKTRTKALRHLFTSHVDYRLFSQFPKRHLEKIVIGRQYILLCYSRKVLLKSYIAERSYVRSKFAVVGVNDDGKLFVNIPAGNIHDSLREGQEIPDSYKYTVNGYTVVPSPMLDNYLRLNVYMYMDDVEDSTVKVCMGQRVYRVQGDLNMIARMVTDSDLREEIETRIIDRILRRITETLDETVTRLASEILYRYRLAIDDMHRNSLNHEVRFRIHSVRMRVYETDMSMLAAYLRRKILDALNSEGVGEYVNFSTVNIDARNIFGENMSEWTIRLKLNYDADALRREIISRYIQDIKTVVSELREIPATIHVGNHTVTGLALPHSIQVQFKNWLTGNTDTVDVTLFSDNEMVTRSAIKIHHDEHGDKVLDWTYEHGDWIEIQFTTIRDADDRRLRNAVVLRQLLKEANEKTTPK
ncbi:MAG: hypothetical protein QW734_08540 [Candidatus Bathyarchaeia archaeon]